MQSRFAYLSQGKLFIKDGAEAEQQITSQFGTDVARRAVEAHQKNQWKTGGEAGMLNRGFLWGAQGSDPTRVVVNITAVCPAFQRNELLYVVQTETVGGLFSYNLSTKKETRIFHREGVRIRDLRKHPSQDLVICSRTSGTGIANLALYQGASVDDITEGDSFDEAPSWVPGNDKQVLFQSAGVGRNAAGYVAGLGPVAIHKLNLDNGNMETLAEDSQKDFLLPQVDSEGNLYFIRRPYFAFGRQPYSVTDTFKDVVLFPFRLCRAVFSFLNVFSMAYAKKPLSTASGLNYEGVDLKAIVLRGRMIDAEKALKQNAGEKGVQSLVPDSWELVRRSKSGAEDILFTGAIAFDLAADGSLLVSNGLAIFAVDQGGRRQLISQTKLVETLTNV